MSVEIRVSHFGESILEVTVTRWLKEVGEPVAAGEILVELETDKVNVGVPADTDGVLEEITAHVGDTITLGAVLGLIAEAAGANDV